MAQIINPSSNWFLGVQYIDLGLATKIAGSRMISRFE